MRPPRVRLTLRATLGLILVLATVLGHLAERAATERRAVARIKQLRGSVQYDLEEGPSFTAELRRPRWLRWVLGDELFRRVIDVNLNGVDLRGADLACLEAFPALIRLHLNRTQLGDDGLARLSRLKLEQLRVLGLSHAGITDAGLARIGAFDGLTLLDLGYNPVTDAGLEHLRPLRDLRVLSLRGTGVAGPGLARLEPLRRLRFADHRGAWTDVASEARLIQARPDLGLSSSNSRAPDLLPALRSPTRRP